MATSAGATNAGATNAGAPNAGAPNAGTDVLIVAIPSTSGQRMAARELLDAMRRAGAHAEMSEANGYRSVRTFMLTDLEQARAARRAALEGIERHRPRAIVYCSVTAALLWPRPGAVWLDAVAAENRPGRHGIWQRRVERRRLRAAPLVLRMAERSLDGLDEPRPPSLVLPTPVERSSETSEARDIDVLAYAGNPVKRRLDFLLAEWARCRRPGERLTIAGVDRVPTTAPQAGVELLGNLAPAEYRATLRRARVFAAAPLREDFGIAPLEALADGCLLATTPAPGAYPALDIARRLDSRLVATDLGRAIRTALDSPQTGYAERAAELMAPFSRAAVDRILTETVLPRLLGPPPSC